MQNDKLKPNPGESLMDWINRTRPNGAPEIQGQPTFDKEMGFVWREGGWVVSVDSNMEFITIQWGAPDGHPCDAYSLNSEGEQWASLDLPGSDGFPQCWPVIA